MAELHSLPDDITLFNILPRLPAKNLLRLKCVSKQWYSFINAALDDGLSMARPFPFTKLSMAYYVAILATRNGLICVGTQEYDLIVEYNIHFYNDLILWNPLTGEYKTLSKANAHKYCFASETSHGLYHASFDDDYKLLCITRDRQVYIYSLKLDSWRKVEKTNILSITTGCLYEPYSCLNESLYFSALPGEIAGYRKIIRFDTKTEKFAEITIPSFKNQRKRFHHLSLLDVRGYIHLCAVCDIQEADSSRWSIELWRMNEDFGDWTKVLSYFWIPASEIVGRNLPLYAAAAVHLTRNGSLLMSLRYEIDIYKIDLDSHTTNKSNVYKFQGIVGFVSSFEC
nr:hypothetical protein [Tanacetum cinerariifolium]